MSSRKNLGDAFNNEVNTNVPNNKLTARFQKIASAITKATGSSSAFLIATSVIIFWAFSRPFFHFSDTWQLVINTSTTIITFLMVFIIQQSQNKDSLAMQLKLNELIACNQRASNRLIVVEDLTQEELEVLKNYYVRLAALYKKKAVCILPILYVNQTTAILKRELRQQGKQT